MLCIINVIRFVTVETKQDYKNATLAHMPLDLQSLRLLFSGGNGNGACTVVTVKYISGTHCETLCCACMKPSVSVKATYT